MGAAQLTVLWPIAVKQQPGIEELVQQTASLLNGRGATPRLFAQQVAFNLSLGKLDLAPELAPQRLQTRRIRVSSSSPGPTRPRHVTVVLGTIRS